MMFPLVLVACMLAALVPYLLPPALVARISPWVFVLYYAILGVLTGVVGLTWLIREARRVFAEPRR